jgi:hypothetical protein
VGPRAGLDGQKNSSPPGFDPGPSARSQSLYRLSYPAHLILNIHFLILCDRVTKTCFVFGCILLTDITGTQHSITANYPPTSLTYPPKLINWLNYPTGLVY